MQPLAQFPLDARRSVRGVLFDIDDTLTTAGRLTAQVYGALERLGAAGLVAIPITGRPAGWCDLIARQWPVDGVVGENGAFYFRYDTGRRVMRRRYADEPAVRAQYRERLRAVREDVLKSVPGCALAADQRYRETDIAIDFCEDVPRLPQSSVDLIVAILQSHGLTAKTSSIHVNGWFGAHDKLTMTKTLMLECFGVDLDADRAAYVFVGDSPNDAPMFAHFPHAIGVANIREFGDRIGHAPAYVTERAAGAGFCEAVEALLAACA